MRLEISEITNPELLRDIIRQHEDRMARREFSDNFYYTSRRRDDDLILLTALNNRLEELQK
jgi:hypothetical protein